MVKDGGGYLLKENREMAKYLVTKINPSYRIAISKIRLSAHKLPIETERYLNTPRVDRICALGCQGIGDEYNYLFCCSHPSIIRAYSPILNELKEQLPELNDMDVKTKFKTILNNSDYRILNLTGKMCHKVLAVFKEVTW